MSKITDEIAQWPQMPDDIWRDGPYRVHKGRQYTVYDDGNSAETPYQTDRADALEARLRDTAAALDALVEAEWMVSHDWGGDRASVMGAAREILARLKEEGLT
jgi:hypothetical protein